MSVTNPLKKGIRGSDNIYAPVTDVAANLKAKQPIALVVSDPNVNITAVMDSRLACNVTTHV